MENVIPRKMADLRVKVGELAAGAAQYEGTIPLLQNKEANIRGESEAFGDSAVGVDQGKAVLNTRRAEVRTAVEAGRAFLTEARNRFRPELGQQQNPGWAPTGLVGSLIIPRSSASVLALLGSFKDFLGNNASFEVPAKNITAAQAGVLFTALEAARVALNLQKKLVDDMQVERNAKATVLRTRMSNTIAELAMRLTPLDSRWLAFGLNKPGAVATPGVPTGVTAALIGPNAVAVEWLQSERARHYRVWLKVVGVDLEFRNVGGPADLDFMIEQLPANAQVQIAVSAVNDGGESAKSETVTVTLPA